MQTDWPMQLNSRCDTSLRGSAGLSLLPPAGQQLEMICDMERYPARRRPSDDGTLRSWRVGRQQSWQRLSNAQCQWTCCAQKRSSTLTASTAVAGDRGPVPSCCLHQTPTRNQNVAPGIVLPIHPVWITASVCCSWPTEAAPSVFYGCCDSPASRSETLRQVKYFETWKQTSIVTSGYFSSCCLSVVSLQSVHSDPWHWRGLSLHTAAADSLDIFLFWGPFSVNPGDASATVKIPADQQLAGQQPVWHQQPFSVSFLTRCGALCKIQEVVCTMSTSLNAPCWCHVMSWFIYLLLRSWTNVLGKVAVECVRTYKWCINNSAAEAVIKWVCGL